MPGESRAHLHASIVHDAQFVAACACGFAYDSPEATPAAAIAAVAATHRHPNAEFRAYPVEYTKHPLYTREAPWQRDQRTAQAKAKKGS